MMLHALTYLQIFSYFFTSLLMFLFPNVIDYTVYVAVIFSWTILSLIYYTFKARVYSSAILKLFFPLLIIALIYWIIPEFYRNRPEAYTSYLIVLVVQTIPFMLSATIVAAKEDMQKKMMKLVPWLAVIFTALAFVSAFNPTSTAGGGLAATEELNYQSISYLAAYSSAFAAYYFISFKKTRWSWPFNYVVLKWAMFALIFVDLLTILISGGRGGIIAFFVIIAFLFFIRAKFGNSGNMARSTAILLMVVVVLLGIGIVHFASTIDMETSGFSRITEFLGGSDDHSRVDVWKTYTNIILSSPIFGHGFGSVFLESDFYAHNLFVDALVETGMVGTIIMFVILCKTVVTGMRLIKIDFLDSLWMVIFLDGLCMGFFSGYYLSHLTLWWAVVFILRKSQLQRRFRHIIMQRSIAVNNLH